MKGSVLEQTISNRHRSRPKARGSYSVYGQYLLATRPKKQSLQTCLGSYLRVGICSGNHVRVDGRLGTITPRRNIMFHMLSQCGHPCLTHECAL
jgi:hypothetical protein